MGSLGTRKGSLWMTRARPPGHVDPLPKGSRAEQNGRAGAREVAEQRRPVGLALDQQWPPPLGAAFAQAGGHGAQRCVRGEEREEAAAGDAGDFVDDLGDGAVVGVGAFPAARAGQVGGDGEEALRGVVEGRGDDGLGDMEVGGGCIGVDFGGLGPCVAEEVGGGGPGGPRRHSSAPQSQPSLQIAEVLV